MAAEQHQGLEDRKFLVFVIGKSSVNVGEMQSHYCFTLATDSTVEFVTLMCYDYLDNTVCNAVKLYT